jgi:large subunit ribosomal protein L21
MEDLPYYNCFKTSHGGKTMYAIIGSGGRQHRVTVGQTIKVNRLDAKVGDEVVLDRVLLLVDGQTIKAGTPLLSGVAVTAQVLEHDRGPKILVFKKKRRQGYHKAQGHRQDYTALRITAIGDPSQGPTPAQEFAAGEEAVSVAEPQDPAAEEAVSAVESQAPMAEEEKEN